MQPEKTVEAFKNVRSGKWFILVDDNLTAKYKLVNPHGKIVNLPDHLFEDEARTVTSDEMPEFFTTEQIQAFEQFQEQLAAAAEREARAQELDRQEAARRPQVVEPSPKRAPSRRRRKPTPSKRGLAVSWTSYRLIFYRNKIEPLDPKQSFKVTVQGEGDYEITKEEFLRTFNDVVMSHSYRHDGLFTYSETPEKAQRFKRS